MIPALRDLVVERGTKRRYRFALKQSATGPAITLAGSSFAGQIRRNPRSALVLDLEPTVEEPASGGIFGFTIDDTAFDAFPDGFAEGIYDILWTQADGMVPKLLRGRITVNGTVTRPTEES